MPDTFYVPMPRSPATELADDIDHLETSIPVLNVEVFPPPPNLATIGAGRMIRSQLESGTASSSTENTLTDSTKDWEENAWHGYILRIVSGTGAGQRRIIVTNDSDSITVSAIWTTDPDDTSDYDIISNVATPDSETIIYTGIATGALTGVTRGVEPEHSSQWWDGGTPISRVLTAQDIRALQNRVVGAEGDIVALQGDTIDHDNRIILLETNDEIHHHWYEIRRIWGAI